jgi:hypothetical protein
MLQLRGVARFVDAFQHQAAHHTGGGGWREGAVLGQQAGSVQRRRGLTRQARGLQPDAQGNGAACRALGQFGQAAQGVGRIAVVQGPARGAHLGAFAHFLFRGVALGRRIGQDLAPMVVALRAVLQSMRGIGRHHVGCRAQPCAVGHGGMGLGQGFLHGQGRQCRFAGAQETAGLLVRQGLEQAVVHGALFLLAAPAPRLMGHLQQRGQGAQRRIQQHEGQHDDGQGQVQ